MATRMGPGEAPRTVVRRGLARAFVSSASSFTDRDHVTSAIEDVAEPGRSIVSKCASTNGVRIEIPRSVVVRKHTRCEQVVRPLSVLSTVIGVREGRMIVDPCGRRRRALKPGHS